MCNQRPHQIAQSNGILCVSRATSHKRLSRQSSSSHTMNAFTTVACAPIPGKSQYILVISIQLFISIYNLLCILNGAPVLYFKCSYMQSGHLMSHQYAMISCCDPVLASLISLSIQYWSLNFDFSLSEALCILPETPGGCLDPQFSSDVHRVHISHSFVLNLYIK